MNRDLRYIFHKITCYLLALVIAGSITLGFSVGVASGMLRTESYVQHKMEKYNKPLLNEVDTAISSVAEDTGLPTKAYTLSVREGHIKTVLHQVSGNMVYGYKTDFSESKYLYGYYRTGIINYCKENGIPITDEDVVRNACFAVDTFNQVCGDESTNYIILFQQTYTKNPLIAIMLSIAGIFGSFIILSFITFGRHKKYDYIGMGIATGGAVLAALPAFAILMKYTSTLHFSDVDVYNFGIADIVNGIFQVLIIIGIVIFIIGIAILMFNYQYFKKKTEKIRTEHQINEKLRKEFLDDHKMKQDEKDALETAINIEAAEQAEQQNN